MNNMESITQITFSLNYGNMLDSLQIDSSLSDNNVVSDITFQDHERTDKDITIDGQHLKNTDCATKASFESLLENVKLDKWKSQYRSDEYIVLDGLGWDFHIDFTDKRDSVWINGSDVFPYTILEFLAFFNIDFNKLVKDFEYELVDVQ